MSKIGFSAQGLVTKWLIWRVCRETPDVIGPTRWVYLMWNPVRFVDNNIWSFIEKVYYPSLKTLLICQSSLLAVPKRCAFQSETFHYAHSSFIEPVTFLVWHSTCEVCGSLSMGQSVALVWHSFPHKHSWPDLKHPKPTKTFLTIIHVHTCAYPNTVTCACPRIPI